ncbi:membrane lipoprotein lipid attachment site-containing protein [Pseudomonas sp. Marseille-Q1929]|uniref:membrane lipoprotein lipid attachment site-containing protein n=1 Tax=Pseudomonas sp. Marseille-Q1929 TaxID=2730402 RepID=UPI001A8E6629|nr:membrane lipoprotein lipid attachment site-containing protein [Pseudomonas sp. Marseille-Q1929]MBO0494602.1 membrane lipoprotein lipid attachment site-containing protein [Pseudomonas sp. Marseille-Q1929]
MKKTLFVLSAVALLAACNQETKEAPKPAPASVQATLVPATPPTDQWVGKWIGVEGLHLTIAKDDSIGRGHYILTMQYGLDADDSGTFKGEAAEDGIAFTRPDGPQLLRAGDGEATGLKWLADKKDCLIVATGEGYCR